MDTNERFNGSPTADGYYTTLDPSKVSRPDVEEEYISPYSVLFFDDCCCCVACS